MKKHLLIFLAAALSTAAIAQEEVQDTLVSSDMQHALDAYMALTEATASGDPVAIQQAQDSMQRVPTAEFSALRLQGGDTISLSQTPTDAGLNRSEATRGQTADGSIYTKTCAVKAGGQVQYSFRSRGHQDLAVAAEAGGRVTMKVHVTNAAGLDRRYDDTQDVKAGRPYRKVSFDLPQNQTNTVTLTVINCSGKDIRFVVMSN